MLNLTHLVFDAAMKRWVTTALLLTGCVGPGQGGHSQPSGGDAAAVSAKSSSARQDVARDPLPALNVVFQVDVFHLTVPFGTFSSNEAFWKRVNEQCVDVPTYDLLYRNGIRVGEAPLSELASFRSHLAEILPAQKLTVTAMEVKNVEVPMKKDLPEQTIFYFDASNRLIGTSFDRCENVLTIAFQPTPRRRGYLRITLCPMVRAQRRLLQFAPGNEQRELAFVQPERLYDLNLRVDIPRESFLIVTASSDASRSTSVGRAFFTLDGPAERMEQVLLVLPTPYVSSEPLTLPR